MAACTMKTKFSVLLLLLIAATGFAGDYEYSVFKIARDAQTKGQRTGRCLLHDRVMVRKTVPLVYGLNDHVKEDTVPADTRVKFFPHAAEFSVSSQAGEKGTPKTAKVFVCPDCQEAEKKWSQDQPK